MDLVSENSGGCRLCAVYIYCIYTYCIQNCTIYCIDNNERYDSELHNSAHQDSYSRSGNTKHSRETFANICRKILSIKSSFLS